MATTHYVGQSAHHVAGGAATIKNVGTQPVFLGGPDVTADNGQKLNRGRSVAVDGPTYAVCPGYAHPGAVSVEHDPSDQ